MAYYDDYKDLWYPNGDYVFYNGYLVMPEEFREVKTDETEWEIGSTTAFIDQDRSFVSVSVESAFNIRLDKVPFVRHKNRDYTWTDGLSAWLIGLVDDRAYVYRQLVREGLAGFYCIYSGEGKIYRFPVYFEKPNGPYFVVNVRLKEGNVPVYAEMVEDGDPDETEFKIYEGNTLYCFKRTTDTIVDSVAL